MPVIACPIPNCTYATDDIDAIIAVALFNTHAIIHPPTPSTNAAAAKVERVKRPTVTSAGRSEEWDYFLVRWRDYVEATKVTGKDRTIQLLECCDEQLRKDVTRSIFNNGRNGSCLTWLATSLEEKRRWLVINASPRGQCSK